MSRRHPGVRFVFFLTVACVAAASGCSRRVSVEPISVDQSGVQIRELDTTLSSGDWNAWRGPRNDGIATVDPEAVPSQWSETENIRWRSDLPGRGHGSPIIVGDQVFLASAIEDSQQQLVICLDRRDGSEQWRTVLHRGGFPASADMHAKSSHANGTIACDGSRLFIAMLNDEAIVATALDLQGEILWQRELGEFASRFGYAPSPILYKSLVIFAADNQGGGYLAAVDGESGELAWRTMRGRTSSYSSPIVANVGGRDQLLISGCGAVTSYDPATGTQLWMTEGTADATCGTVVISDERIFASGGYPQEQTLALSPEGDELWSSDLATYETSMIIAGPNLVAVSDDGVAYCWLAESGELLWKKRLGGNFSSSPLLVGDRIYAANLNGETFVFRAGDQYEAIAKNELGDDVYASPAVAGDQLFLRIGVGQGDGRREQLVCISSTPAI